MAAVWAMGERRAMIDAEVENEEEEGDVAMGRKNVVRRAGRLGEDERREVTAAVRDLVKRATGEGEVVVGGGGGDGGRRRFAMWNVNPHIDFARDVLVASSSALRKRVVT